MESGTRREEAEESTGEQIPDEGGGTATHTSSEGTIENDSGSDKESDLSDEKDKSSSSASGSSASLAHSSDSSDSAESGDEIDSSAPGNKRRDDDDLLATASTASLAPAEMVNYCIML